MANAIEKNTEMKKHYFQLLILQSVVLRAVNNKKVRRRELPVNCVCRRKDSESNSSIQKLMAANGAYIQLQDNANSDESVVVLDEHLTHHVSCLKKLSDMVILKTVKPSICNFSLNVLSYHGQSASQLLILPKISQFHKVLANEMEDMKLLRFVLYTYKAHRNEYFQRCFQLAASAISLMKEILQIYQSQSDTCLGLANFYISKIEALLQKAKMLNLELLTATYNEERVLSLRMIRQRLQAKNEEVERNIMEKNIALQVYKCAGNAFEDIVEEYANLSLAIQNERWALEELEKSENAE